MIQDNKHIAVMGCGSWGGTIAQYLASAGNSVIAWHKFADEVADMRKSRRHPFIPDLHFSEKVEFTLEYPAAVTAARMVIIAVPSHIVRHLMEAVAPWLEADTVVVNLAKGIENDTLMTMSQIIHNAGNVPRDRIVALYGPSHAEEVARRIPTTLVAACPSLPAAQEVQSIFSSPVLRVYTNTDILGVELGGSLKNVIAIAAGICDGIGFGDNTKAALLTRGITEITRLGIRMGAQADTFSGLSGIGDLIATCLSKHSRNRYVGEEIGKGRTLEDILAGMKMVAEGIKTTKSVFQLSHKYQVEMPISTTVYEVLFNSKDPTRAVHDLMTRDLKSEVL